MKGKKKLYELIPPRLYPYIIAIFVFLLFGNTIFNDYSLDDDNVTVTNQDVPNNPRIEKGINGIPDLFTSRYVSNKLMNYCYRPLPLATFATEYEFFKSNPHISHLINVILYLLTCLLLFKMLELMFSGMNNLFSFIITLFFIAHPVHTEVVASLKNRDEILCFLFGLSTLYFSLKYFDSKKIKHILLSLLFFWCAFFSKETALVLIMIVPMTIYFFRPVRVSGKLLIFTSIIIISAILFFVLKNQLLHDEPVSRVAIFTENPLYHSRGMLIRIPTAFISLAYYLKLLFIPFPLSAYYGYNTIPFAGWSSVLFWISLIVYLFIGIFALFHLPKKKVFSYGIFFYLLAIAPFSNIIKVVPGIVGDRFAYYASLGFCIVIVYFIFKILKIPYDETVFYKKLKTSFIAFVFAILCLYSIITVSRNSEWKNLITLFRHDVKYYDNSFNLHYLLAKALTLQITDTPAGTERNKLIEESLIHYRKITAMVKVDIEKHPEDYILWSYLGTVYDGYLNDATTARRYFKQSLSAKPGYPEALYNLALNFENSGLPDSAVIYYKKSIEKDFNAYMAYTRLHEIYFKREDYENACKTNEYAIKTFPDQAQFYVNLGNISLIKHDTLNGVDYFMQAVGKEPSNTNLKNQIINFLKKNGYNEEAETLREKFP